MESVWLISALWIGLALVSALISIRVGISVALIEIIVGSFGGNLLGLTPNDWISYLASLGAVLLTFLAGTELDPVVVRKHLGSTLSIGAVGFIAPYLGVLAYAHYALGWPWPQAQIAGIALSTTSLAVVYAVLVETGLNRELVGKRLMSATFVTDIATVTGLTLLFLKPTLWIVPFALVSVGLVFGLPYTARHFFPRYGNRVIEPEIKLVFACLFLLMWLGARANSQAALPAFVLGLAMSRFFASHRLEQDRLRVVSFAFLTPFFFLKGGLNVSTSALWANLGILGLLVAAKMGPKLLGVYPLARRFTAPHATFTTLLMSTGLTFGTITSLYGLSAGIIDRTQFSLLIAVVVLSAIVPTAIAQRFYQPRSATHRDLTAPVAPAPTD